MFHFLYITTPSSLWLWRESCYTYIIYQQGAGMGVDKINLIAFTPAMIKFNHELNAPTEKGESKNY